MKHRKSGVKLNRTSSHRNAMFRNMVTSLFKHDRITTTDKKAKELRRVADRMITLAKRGDLHAKRQALSFIREKDVVYRLFDEAPTRFEDINGGYTRIVKIGRRAGDAAPISVIELVASEKRLQKDKKKKSKEKSGEKPASKAKTAAQSETKSAPAADTGQTPPISGE